MASAAMRKIFFFVNTWFLNTKGSSDEKSIDKKKAEGFGGKTFSFVLSFDKTNKNDYFELKKVVLDIF